MSPDYISLEGPVELVNGKLTVAIPIEVAGDLVECSKGIGSVRGAELVIVLPEWLTNKLSIAEGSVVIVDNKDGKFNIRKRSVN